MGLCPELSEFAAAVAVPVDAAEGSAAATAAADAVVRRAVAGMVVILLAWSEVDATWWSLARRPVATKHRRARFCVDKNNDQFEFDVLNLSPAIEAFESDCPSFGAFPRHYTLY